MEDIRLTPTPQQGCCNKEENDNYTPGEVHESNDCSSAAEETRTGKKSVVKNHWTPKYSTCYGSEKYWFAGYEIFIQESIDSYGAVPWPGAEGLCSYMENNQQELNLTDKTVLELGAGTGLVSILASLLGARVIATDLPDILGNMRFNIARNTRNRSRTIPDVKELCWGQNLEQNFPKSQYRFDYVLAADVVYSHNYLDELIMTMEYFCQPGTVVLWANKFRLPTDYKFVERFSNTFDAKCIANFPDIEVKLFRATVKQ
ncbi:protein-lysine methyltransferase METTL21C [Protopterus annectens]|uniref:protein-lysine methyltransferase METTL21C n=1 Tax=Protopterus annectens TaxID=7888 RepID=UPI001CFB7380|nr:protein-lysine methyltransferase METTL21C [Protopterus annectens]